MEYTIKFSFKGKTVAEVVDVSSLTAHQLYQNAYTSLQVDPETTSLKLLLKGKRLDPQEENDLVFPDLMEGSASNDDTTSSKKKVPKILVMATPLKEVAELQSKRSDPTIRGFQALPSTTTTSDSNSNKNPLLAEGYWGKTQYPNASRQHVQYKFCKIQACTWQSFGHRPMETTPHAFAALQLLERLATDPGIKAIVQERELVVGVLGEMDPIDDRLMKDKQAVGACLLGYNTNHGSRIDLKLRTDNLAGFRPYHEIVCTLIHELSHNWVGEHDCLFWTNFGQMLVEYLYTHLAPFVRTLKITKEQTTAQLAQIPIPTCEQIVSYVMQVLQKDMAQHGLQPQVIAAAIQERYHELVQSGFKGAATDMMLQGGHILGSAGDSGGGDALMMMSDAATATLTPRERALRAAEERVKRQQQQNEDKKDAK